MSFVGKGRFAAVLCCLLAGACAAPISPPGPVPVTDPLPGVDTCGRAEYAALIGQDATALERVLILRQVRVLRPGMAMTMDFSAERINFRIDDAGRISQITCG